MLTMFERYTPSARQVIVFAQEEARGLRHNAIGSEHLLIGLLRDELGNGGRALRGLGLDVGAVHERVGAMLPRGRRDDGRPDPVHAARAADPRPRRRRIAEPRARGRRHRAPAARARARERRDRDAGARRAGARRGRAARRGAGRSMNPCPTRSWTVRRPLRRQPPGCAAPSRSPVRRTTSTSRWRPMRAAFSGSRWPPPCRTGATS